MAQSFLWIAKELHTGTWTHMVNRLKNAKDENAANEQSELGLV